MVAEPEPYADTATYQLGADWLAPCELVADWGCGKGWFRQFVKGDYLGIDGSQSPFADVIADLADYRSETPGVFLRHVLEHDLRWPLILANAVASFTQRLVLVLFTPLADETHDMEWEPDPGVPNLSFALADLLPHFAGCQWRYEILATPSKYGLETIFYLERP
jgi:hypothetical protein